MENEETEQVEHREPCRKHYFQASSFDKCPDCGWRGEFKPKN